MPVRELAVLKVGDRGGWQLFVSDAANAKPVKTAEGYLFACDCGSGTWYLAGDHNGWEPAELARAGDLSWIEVAIDEPDEQSQ